MAVRPLPMDPSRVVLEIDAAQPADDALVAVLREARDAGFHIALDGFHSGAEGLLDLADSVKIDVASLDEDAIEDAVNVARGLGLQLIADGVQTREQYGICRGLGFDAFQGQYFAEPVIITG